jgi:hypothetical protein
MTTQRERRNVFGEAVEDYDAYRPGYPAALVDDVLAAAGTGPALEVGAHGGTIAGLVDTDLALGRREVASPAGFHGAAGQVAAHRREVLVRREFATSRPCVPL